MAIGLINDCCFQAASGGTGDFVVSGAITGFLAPADADAVNGTEYTYRAEITDLSQWETGVGTWNAGSGTLERTTVENSSNSGSPVNFASSPRVWVSTGRSYQFPPEQIPGTKVLTSDGTDMTWEDAAGGSSWFSTYTEVTLDSGTPYDWDGSTYELRITTDGSGLGQQINFTGTPLTDTPYMVTVVNQADPGDIVTFSNVYPRLLGSGGMSINVSFQFSATGAQAGFTFQLLDGSDATVGLTWFLESSVIKNDSGNIYRLGSWGSGIVQLTIVPPGPFNTIAQTLKVTSDGTGTPNQLLLMDVADKAGIYKIEFENQVDPSDTIELYPNTAFISSEGTVDASVLNAVGDFVFIQGAGSYWQLLSYNTSGGIVITPYPSGTFEAVGGEMLTFTTGILTSVA